MSDRADRSLVSETLFSWLSLLQSVKRTQPFSAVGFALCAIQSSFPFLFSELLLCEAAEGKGLHQSVQKR